MSNSLTRSALPGFALLFLIGLPASSAAPPTTHAFSIIDGGGGRVFFLERERRIPVQVRNDGFVTWDAAAGFNLSYQWLSPSGELLAEGFRTRLVVDVPPGESFALSARVKDLPGPGIYRFRWDMVHEGVTWFSERDRSPEPARWVVVLPTLGFFFVLVLPSLAAIGGLLLWHFGQRGRWPLVVGAAAAADLLWAAVSLVGKPFLLYADLPRRFIPAIEWSTLSAVALPLLLLALFPRRLRAWAAWVTVTCAALLVWGQTLYLRFFGDVATSAAVLASRQTGEIRESISFLAGPSDWWLLVDLLLALPLVVTLGRENHGRPRRLLATVLLASLMLPLIGGLRDLSDYTTGRNLRTLRDVRDFGLYGYQFLDTATLVADELSTRAPDDAEIEAIVNLFRKSADTRAAVGPAAGIAAGRNLIGIQVESMQQFVLEFEVDGRPVTPNLLRLAESGLMFTAVEDQTSRGRSSAGDYVVNTSVLPVAESVAYQYSGNAHRGYAHVLREHGYTTVSAIPYRRHFWNRYRTHPAYGFDTNLFVEDFAPGVEVGWGLNDIDFLEQMVPRLEALPEPFAAWLTTLSVHHPYRSFPEELRSLDLGELEGTALGNYLHGMNLLDRAIGRFFRRLESNGLLDRTVVALWGDHSSGLLREDRWVEYFGLEESGAERFQFRRVPFLLWVPGAPELRGRIDDPAGQIDIAPTLLAIHGANPAREPFLGRNLLGRPGRGPVVHPQGSWISTDLLYLNPREDDSGAIRCWNPRTARREPAQACRELNSVALRQIDASTRILRFDLQMAIGERLGRDLN
jgi:phosphoglycerol transferase MdoB-like AlkP superfamily enzyme